MTEQPKNANGLWPVLLAILIGCLIVLGIIGIANGTGDEPLDSGRMPDEPRAYNSTHAARLAYWSELCQWEPSGYYPGACAMARMEHEIVRTELEHGVTLE